MTNDTEFSTAAGRRMLKSETDKRVAEEAAIKSCRLLQEYGTEVSELAVEFAEMSGRKTVRAVDVRKALRQLKQ